MQLNLHGRDGVSLEPRRYSSGKTQVDLVEEILDALGRNDMVFLKGGVGSGKSVVGLRTILEFGRGVVSVPTKVLSDQYAESYERDLYFTNRDGEKAEIGVLKGRGNFACPHTGRPASDRILPCTRRVNYAAGERRLDALQRCPYWGFIFQKGWTSEVESLGVKPIPYSGIGGDWILCLKGKCPYWEQFKAYVSADALVMNSAKWAAEVATGRLPNVPITVVDEADYWLDQLAVRVSVTKRTIERLTKIIPPNERRYLTGLWSATLSSGDPIELAEQLVTLLEDVDETSGNLYWKLRTVLEHREWVECERGEDKVLFFLPDPRPILQRLLDKVGGKWLFMSATAQSAEVLEGVFGINPIFVEGETSFPGRLIRRWTGSEMVVNNHRWNDDKFRTGYSRLRSKILRESRRPAFVPVHSYRYAPRKVAKKMRESGNDLLEQEGVMYSTKMDRGIDLAGMGSIIMLKFPYPNRKDPVLQGMKRRLGPEAFDRYYLDMSRREFIQQIGRVMRSDRDKVEFWSPDARCHQMLQQLWKGDIDERHTPTNTE